MYDHDESLDEARARNVRDALMEDIGRCDWTAQLAPAGQRVRARVLVRDPDTPVDTLALIDSTETARLLTQAWGPRAATSTATRRAKSA